jgi:hypothetical protein
MNQHYLNRYLKFIDALKNQSIDGYSEKHHIIPRSMGGTDAKDNLINLTGRQHYLAHWMLWKAYGGSMTRAFFMMSSVKKGSCRSSKRYDKARQEYAEEVRKQMTGKPAQSKFTPEHREKLRQAKLGKKLSVEHRANVGKARIGIPLSEEHKRKISMAKQIKRMVA